MNAEERASRVYVRLVVREQAEEELDVEFETKLLQPRDPRTSQAGVRCRSRYLTASEGFCHDTTFGFGA